MTELSGKRALVTGGATGIGAACSLALARAGAEVVVTGRNESRLKSFAEGNGLFCAAMDITDEASVQAGFEKAGRIDILVANAGAAETAPLRKTETAMFERLMAVNLTGTFLTMRAFLQQVEQDAYGRVVAVASTAALKGYAFTSAYAAAKHGVLGLIRSAALELAKTKVTANAVCPGFTRTQIAEDAIQNIMAKTGRSQDEAVAELARFNPQRRLVEPEEVAGAVLALLPDAAGSINGQAIAVDGGETAS